MAVTIPADYADLLKPETKAFASLAIDVRSLSTA